QDNPPMPPPPQQQLQDPHPQQLFQNNPPLPPAAQQQVQDPPPQENLEDIIVEVAAEVDTDSSSGPD
ncbi:hypothetical protein A2U01_0118922, partial [Trifolium medium]|nr:hypothetical protein [Trifolium medium]